MLKQKPCIRIKLTNTEPDIFSSKAGGLGYIPHDGDFPVAKEGNQLRLLAQIDCSQVDFENFPKTGLLQFWFLNDDVYGLDGFGEDAPEAITQDTFRVIYYPEIDRTVTREEILQKYVKSEYDEDEDCTPVSGEYGMTFEPAESYEIPDYSDDEENWEEFSKLSGDAPQHRIGGYPYFTQDDPRMEDSPYDFLLFQLDSDFENQKDRVLWGDAGIANFFINSEKLKNLDFSDVLYNWDCC